MDFQYQLTVQFCKKYGIDQFRKKTELTNSVKNAELMVQFRKKKELINSREGVADEFFLTIFTVELAVLSLEYR